MLKNAGCAPAWVEQGKRIREAAAVAAREVALDWIECGRPELGTSSVGTTLDAARASGAAGGRAGAWAEAVCAFDEEMARINALVDSYNLQVPAVFQSVLRYSPEKELHRALLEAPAHAAASGGRRRRRARAGGDGDGGRRGGGGATFPAATPIPSFAEALASVLVPSRH